jgi:hypothetical protein
MFYADRMLYLFEGTAEPIYIPRLPIRIDTDMLRQYAAPLAMMAEAYAELPLSDLEGLAQALYDVYQESAMISTWGELLWRQGRAEILAGELLDLPHLHYLPSFRRDFKTLTPAQRIDIQSALAKAAVLLRQAKGATTLLKQDGGLQYSDLAGKRDGNKPIGHFRASLNLRISCVAGAGGLTLRHCGLHDTVNDHA